MASHGRSLCDAYRTEPDEVGVEKFLGSRPMVYLGGLSYGLYLWRSRFSASITSYLMRKMSVCFLGLIIIALSLVLSYLSTTLIEELDRLHVSKHNFTLKAFRPIFALIGALVIAVGAWFGITQYQSFSSSDLAGSTEYPGAMVNSETFDQSEFEEKEPIPSMSEVKEDKEESYTNGCQQDAGEAEVELCEYGVTENPEHTVAVVGGSKATHWTSPVKKFAEEENIKVLNVTKSGCRLSLDPVEAEDCNEWNENVADALADAEVDLVVDLSLRHRMAQGNGSAARIHRSVQPSQG